VLKELQLKRRASAAFQGKKGFITLRDLFRWAFRYGRGRPSNIGEEGEKFYDWDLHMAEEGFLVLASRIRKEAEVQTVREAIEKFFKKKIDEAAIFSLEKPSLVLKPEMQLLKQERKLPIQAKILQ
jgi:midasin